MKLSAEWRRFVDEYSADGIYWYVPKGGTADSDEFRSKFRVFSRFAGQVWKPQTQRDIVRTLRQEHLSTGGNALPRQIKRVFQVLGLCWISDNEPIRITSAGNAYLEEGEEGGRSRVLDRQVWRYQLPTPVNSSHITAGIKLHPHAYFVNALLACRGHITGEEYSLFIARARTHQELPITVQRVLAWRNEPEGVRAEVTRALTDSYFDTINRDHTYALAFHHCDLLLHRGRGGLFVEDAQRGDLENRVGERTDSTEIIEFRHGLDYVASVSDVEQSGTPIDALDYYIDISDVDKAVQVYRRLPPLVRGEKSPEEFEAEQLLERHLEDWLQHHLDVIEPGLTLIRRQHPTGVGPIDILARAKNGDFVVLELKKGRASDKVFGQICRYMGYIKSDQPEDAPQAVRGYIVCREIDDKLRFAVKVVDRGVISLQIFEPQGEKGNARWIHVRTQ